LRSLLGIKETDSVASPDERLSRITTRFVSNAISTTGRIASGERLSTADKYVIVAELTWLAIHVVRREVALDENGGERIASLVEEALAQRSIDEITERFFGGQTPPLDLLDEKDELRSWFLDARAAYRSCKASHPSEAQMRTVLKKGPVTNEYILGRLANRLAPLTTRKAAMPFPNKVLIESLDFYNTITAREVAYDLIQDARLSS
jgi:hypothetical protein